MKRCSLYFTIPYGRLMLCNSEKFIKCFHCYCIVYTEESKRKTGVKMNSLDSERDSFSARIDKYTHYQTPEE
jgi:hypothetical protein